MTDRYAGFVVVLDHDIREDDAEGTIQAIRHLRHVADVKPVNGVVEVAIAESRVRLDLWQKIREIFADSGQ